MIPPGIGVGIEGEPRRLIRLQDLHAGRRQQPQNRGDRQDPRDEQDDELPPAEADEEQHGEERRRVHERRAEIGLHEHEEDRSRTEPDDREDRLPAGGRPDAVDGEAGESEHEEDLPELRRLELDDAEVEPALRASDGLRRDEDDDHQSECRAVHELPVAAPEVDRDHGGDEKPDHADRGRESLTNHEVLLVTRDVEARDAPDDPQAVADEPRCRGEQDPVEAPEERDESRLGAAREGLGAARLGDLDHGRIARHQSVSTKVACGASTLKNRSKTLSAAGAAALEPCPPFSIRAQTTSFAESDGPQPHHHDWSSRWPAG